MKKQAQMPTNYPAQRQSKLCETVLSFLGWQIIASVGCVWALNGTFAKGNLTKYI